MASNRLVPATMAWVARNPYVAEAAFTGGVENELDVAETDTLDPIQILSRWRMSTDSDDPHSQACYSKGAPGKQPAIGRMQAHERPLKTAAYAILVLKE